MRILSFICLHIAVTFPLVEGLRNGNTAGPCKPGEKLGSVQDLYIDSVSIIGGRKDCINGTADIFPCNHVALESYISIRDLNAGEPAIANDLWGWTSSDGREFAIIGLFDGVSFVEITDPINPVVLGKIPSHTSATFWRDIKTYDDHAYIVSDVKGHGMQVFNLTQLLNVAYESYTIFSPTSHYSDFGRAHNIFINEDSSYAYIVGSNKCNGGLLMLDIIYPSEPYFVGCYSDRGYVHDVQCVIYDGPDSEHVGKEICFACNEHKVDIIDVSNKLDPIMISTFQYEGEQYTHQGWLTEDQHYFLIDDELDEYEGTNNTKTYICDVRDLDHPLWLGTYTSELRAIDHNQYVKGNYVYQANYQSGLRILALDYVSNGLLYEVGYFDTYPEDDTNNFNGAWSNYAYFDSGIIIVSDIERGLFVVRPDLPSMSLLNNSAVCIDANEAYFNISLELTELNSHIKLQYALNYTIGNQTQSNPLNNAEWLVDDDFYEWGQCLQVDRCYKFEFSPVEFSPETSHVDCCKNLSISYAVDFNGENIRGHLNHFTRHQESIGNCNVFNGSNLTEIISIDESDHHTKTNISLKSTENATDMIANKSVSRESSENIEPDIMIDDRGQTFAQVNESDTIEDDVNSKNETGTYSSFFNQSHEVFISNLDAVVSGWNDGMWSANITATVSDEKNTQVSGVSLLGTDGNGEREISCTTKISSMCTLTFENILDESITFQIVRLWKEDYTYNKQKNHDLDGDSDGTFISVTAPTSSSLRRRLTSEDANGSLL